MKANFIYVNKDSENAGRKQIFHTKTLIDVVEAYNLLAAYKEVRIMIDELERELLKVFDWNLEGNYLLDKVIIEISAIVPFK
jgi:hypothetical protein